MGMLSGVQDPRGPVLGSDSGSRARRARSGAALHPRRSVTFVHFFLQILTGKTDVTPSVRLTVPREQQLQYANAGSPCDIKTASLFWTNIDGAAPRARNRLPGS